MGWGGDKNTDIRLFKIGGNSFCCPLGVGMDVRTATWRWSAQYPSRLHGRGGLSSRRGGFTIFVLRGSRADHDARAMEWRNEVQRQDSSPRRGTFTVLIGFPHRAD
jgi:hypothetical protein